MKISIPQQDAIEIFWNFGGTITISQDNFGGDLSLISIHPKNIDVLIRALREAKKSLKEA